MANIPHEVESCCKLCGTVLAFHLDIIQPLALMNALKSRQKAANYYAIMKHPVQHNGQHHRSQSPEHEVHSCTTMDGTKALTHLHSIIPSIGIIPFTCFTHNPMVKLHNSIRLPGTGHRTQLLPCGLQTSFDLGGIVAEWIQHKAPLF